MLSITNLSYFLGERVLFDAAQLHIKPKEKIGLVGLNGTGKTTLLRIISGETTPDGGEISKRNDCTIGYLNQDLLSFQSDDSILSVAMGAFAEAAAYEQKIEHTLKLLETDHSEKLLIKLTSLQEKFEALGGYTLESQAEEILEGVGFKTSDLHRPLSEFSGGWRMRVILAKLLLQKPALLMLDEPTNHLDLPSIQWVENYLRNYDGAVIIVSHDKYFLDNCVNKIVEVSYGKLNSYSGNYSYYQEEKELRDQFQKNAFLNQQQKIKQAEQFINRFRAKSTKARQVQSRVKSLEKMDVVDDVQSASAPISFNFSISTQSGRHLVRMEEVSKSYGDIEVLKPSTVSIERGDKIALIGANGIGKSTLLRIIANKEPHGGKVETGYNVVTAFYAQHQIEALTLENEILDELKQFGTNKMEQELRTVLGCFLFTGEDVFKKIKVLSGGEKSRVALAKTLISAANFLLLDEPTNHLDIVSVNILVQALQQYKGTFVLVSHDRYFISEVANKIWYIDQQTIREYPGTYPEYEEWRRRNAEKVSIAPEPEPKKEPEKKQEPKKQSDQDKQRNAQLQKRIQQVEAEIETLEKEKSEIERELSATEVYSNPDKLQSVNESYLRINSQLAGKTQVWENLVEELEKMK
jgi:ATP-binding cassette, subfamily F, member 3